jgi:hypothetical protein
MQRTWKQRLSSRKFILAMIAQLTGIAVLVFPGYENEIAQASEHIGAMLLMAVTGFGWIKAEAEIDTAGTVAPALLAGVLAPSMLVGCAAWQQADLLQKYVAARETYITVQTDLLALKRNNLIEQDQWDNVVLPLLIEADTLLDNVKAAARDGDTINFETYWQSFKRVFEQLLAAQLTPNNGVTRHEPQADYDSIYSSDESGGLDDRQQQVIVRAGRRSPLGPARGAEQSAFGGSQGRRVCAPPPALAA